jgi:hypothetical protein
MINDQRTKDIRPIKEVRLWAVATDRVLSGWGMAPRKSYVAYPLDKLNEQGRGSKLTDWMDDRTDFLRVRINLRLPRLQDGDHLSIYDVHDEMWRDTHYEHKEAQPMTFQCDYGHETEKEVRRLPIGNPEDHAGLFVCRAHFIKETLSWSNRPAWDSLPLQYADETETEAHDPDDHECEYLGSGMWSCGHCDQS